MRKKVRALSKGNRQKVQLIAALATRAELLLLDEPTAGLDPLMEVAFRDSIVEAKQREQTVFLSSHILSEVEALCDRIGILRAGRLIDQGTLAQLRHLSVQTVEVTFAGEAPVIAPLDGVSAVRVGPDALRFEVSGPIGPLITALGAHQVCRSAVMRRRWRRSSCTTTACRTGAMVPPTARRCEHQGGADRGNRAGAGR